MKKASISIVLSIIAIITCIINFFVFNIRVAPYEFDVYGVLVGILGILVTFLLGWQIFSVFQMKKEIDKLKADISQEVDTEIEKLKKEIKKHESPILSFHERVIISFCLFCLRLLLLLLLIFCLL